MIKYIYSIQKIQDTFCFSEQQQIAQKKFNTVKKNSVFRASTSCSKILNYKKYFNTVKNFRATLFFRASASCSNILNDKKYIFNTVNSGHILFFRARASCSTKIQYSEKFQGKLCFGGQAQVAQNPGR